MQTRKADVNDAKVMAQIHAESWKVAYRGFVPDSYLDELSADRWNSIFAESLRQQTMSARLLVDGEKPIGCAFYGRSRDELYSDYGEIVSLYLLPNYIGKGYGRILIKAVQQELQDEGFPKYFLWVLEENKQARKFYEKCGFSCNEEKHYIEVGGKTLCTVRYIY